MQYLLPLEILHLCIGLRWHPTSPRLGDPFIVHDDSEEGVLPDTLSQQKYVRE